MTEVVFWFWKLVTRSLVDRPSPSQVRPGFAPKGTNRSSHPPHHSQPTYLSYLLVYSHCHQVPKSSQHSLSYLCHYILFKSTPFTYHTIFYSIKHLIFTSEIEDNFTTNTNINNIFGMDRSAP